MWPSKAEEWEYLEAKVNCLLRSLDCLREGLVELQETLISLSDSRYYTSSSPPPATMRVQPVRQRR